MNLVSSHPENGLGQLRNVLNQEAHSYSALIIIDIGRAEPVVSGGQAGLCGFRFFGKSWGRPLEYWLITDCDYSIEILCDEKPA